MQHEKVRQGGNVKRYHTIQINGEQTVASHSWGVAMLIRELWPNCSKELLCAALDHDIPEGITGDTPFTAKSRFPGIRSALTCAEEELNSELGLQVLLSDKYRARLKVADMLELLWFCLDQHQLGNKGIDECFWTGVDHLRAKSQEPQVTAMVNELCVVVENT